VISRANNASILDALAVEEGAINAIKIFNCEKTLIEKEATMTTRDSRRGNANRVPLGAAEEGGIMGKFEDRATSAVVDDQADVHRDSEKGSIPGTIAGKEAKSRKRRQKKRENGLTSWIWGDIVRMMDCADSSEGSVFSE
jgi:hypothetical protein